MSRCVVCHCHTQTLLCKECQTLIKPPEYGCQQCAKPMPKANHHGTLRCPDCRKAPPAFNHIKCAGIYQPPGSDWVMALKFSGHLHWARAMAELLQPVIKDIAVDWPLMAMPLHRRRLRTRGYNQAFEMTRLLAGFSGRQVLTNVLERNKYTAMQATLPEKQRRANVRDAFTVKHNDLPQSVLLVDDVLTTGQTLSAAAASLKKAGVDQVYGVVFLRSAG
ncbi:ComF family protein [Marinicella gelatinilytica]|uniref:ComF family protein n=1 Tax=Marinicella gelatinilytica TaxID=2996017 RepID=UPI002260B6B1|nr:phosphoribosyltransferase family protein [Marinicella gelatinilytica]MCX7544940.1 phosphoribosyltransferase family protein [Marinicella gelatinilytica]